MAVITQVIFMCLRPIVLKSRLWFLLIVEINSSIQTSSCVSLREQIERKVRTSSDHRWRSNRHPTKSFFPWKWTTERMRSRHMARAEMLIRIEISSVNQSIVHQRVLTELFTVIIGKGFEKFRWHWSETFEQIDVSCINIIEWPLVIIRLIWLTHRQIKYDWRALFFFYFDWTREKEKKCKRGMQVRMDSDAYHICSSRVHCTVNYRRRGGIIGLVSTGLKWRQQCRIGGVGRGFNGGIEM